MDDSTLLITALDTEPAVARTHVSEPGTSIRNDGNPDYTEIEVELDPDASADERGTVQEIAEQNGWTVNSDWGTHVWLLLQT